MEKTYLAVVAKAPASSEWVEEAPIAPDPAKAGRMRVDAKLGLESRTEFAVLESGAKGTLLRAKPLTGRTHQIRVHLAHAGLPVLGDPIYGTGQQGVSEEFPLGLRAVGLAYRDPFTGRAVRIGAALERFARAHGCALPEERLRRMVWPPAPRGKAAEHKPDKSGGFSV